jgi:hypothetical protein
MEGSALVIVYCVNAIFECRESTFYAFSRESWRSAAPDQLTLFRGPPLSPTERFNVASQLQYRKGLLYRF